MEHAHDTHVQVWRLGLIADPDTPQQVAERLAESLPEDLGGEHHRWEIDVEVDPVTAGLHDTREILDLTARRRRERGWQHAICLTDLPLRIDRRPVVTEIDHDQAVALISLPSLGGFQPRRRVRQVIRQVLDELATERPLPSGEETRTETARHGLSSPLTRIIAPIRRHAVTGEEGGVDVRYLATRIRGRLRLLTGMVRTNRPWRLVFGMSKALAAAIAASAFGLSSSTIWQLGDQLGAVNQILAMVAALTTLVVWLITAHHLWETSQSAQDRDQAWLYNTSTVLTLTLGVTSLLAILFAVNLALAAFLVPSSLLASTLGHPAEPVAYVSLAWSFTTMGTLAGALGSSLESDQAVRQAAYGYRESQRRGERRHDSETGPGT